MTFDRNRARTTTLATARLAWRITRALTHRHDCTLHIHPDQACQCRCGARWIEPAWPAIERLDARWLRRTWPRLARATPAPARPHDSDWLQKATRRISNAQEAS